MRAGSHTPLKTREYQQQAQRCVRLAVNTLNRGRDQWEEASSRGRSALTELSNAALEESGLASCELGALSSIPGLLDAAKGKLKRLQDARLRELEGETEALRNAAATVASAAASISELISEKEEDDAARDLPRSKAVFHSLPLVGYEVLFREIADKYEAEIAVKDAIVADLCERLRGADDLPVELAENPREPEPVEVADGSPLLRVALQVCVATWMLEAELDLSRVEEIVVSIVQEEMRGF